MVFDSVNPSSPFHNVPMDGSFTLYPGQSIFSPNKKQELEMQRDGNLVNYKRNDDGSREVLWASNTAGYPGAYAWFQRDANLVVYTPDGTARWEARVRFDFVGVGSYFALPDEGKMYIVAVPTVGYANVHARDAQHVWTYKKDEKYFDTQIVIFPYYKVPMDGSFTLHPGQCIYSPNKKQQLIMQSGGNLVHYRLNDDGSQVEFFGHHTQLVTMELMLPSKVMETWSFTHPIPTAKSFMVFLLKQVYQEREVLLRFLTLAQCTSFPLKSLPTTGTTRTITSSFSVFRTNKLSPLTVVRLDTQDLYIQHSSGW